MKNWKRLKALPVYIAMASIVSGCGAATTAFQNSAGTGANSNGSSNPFLNPIPVPSPTQSTSLSSALNYEIGNTGISGTAGSCKDCLTGQGGNYPVYSTQVSSGSYISTDNLLQVKVSVQSGGLLSATGAAAGTQYSGFSATYDCASFQVDVLDQNGNSYGSQQTGMLAVPGSQGCFSEYNGGASSETLDFSGNLSQGPHGGLDVRVTALNYDFYCKLLYTYLGALATESEYYSFWCPNKIVYKNHSVSAQLQVEVNGTTF